MEQRRLSPSEVAECIRLARYLWGGGISGPRQARQDMRDDMLLTSRKVSAALKGARGLAMFGGRASGKTYRAERTRSVEIASEVLDWTRGRDLGAIEKMIGGKSLNSVLRQYDKGVRAGIKEWTMLNVEAMQNDIGADKLLHLLTSWT